ncbi:TonB-dependent receptor [Helicobacter saguini]|uniref:TonB-dependent receptor n=1 Tax=Helicobacter saguini TaxID=1548018 RepID=A0A347VGS2_9HELI|nr:TonB-dependent receptor [Helicobacter saguini]MWV62007.1 TonB-dependent receptor [Helicobacter saguini]MWV67318.1 TonB-dependent receptor [Helicobacter saguini]MWV69671.1 TonB-dependent receptor [Helicobacter saguini]MWV73112.1 TonB-dependent receptor [Helicobacter saguini]TLD95521.1 TonB-dependent receptor [Helicobacter saguini]
MLCRILVFLLFINIAISKDSIESNNIETKQNIESITLASNDIIQINTTDKQIELINQDLAQNNIESKKDLNQDLAQNNIKSNTIESLENEELALNDNFPPPRESYTIDKVVTSVKGTEQLLKDAPASITIITSDELENKPHRDLAEALADIPGIDTATHIGKTGGFNISIRGMPASYTLILIDGKRVSSGGDVNTANIGYSEANTSFMPPLNAIERIEVIRGPMGTLYGSDAIGGVVNIITKKSFDKAGVNLSFDTIQNENRNFGANYMLNFYAVTPLIKDKLGLQIRGRYMFRPESRVNYTYEITQNPPTDLNANTTRFPNKGEFVTQSPRFTGSPTRAFIHDTAFRLLFNPSENHNLYFDVQYAGQIYDNSKGQIDFPQSTASEYKITRNNYVLNHRGDMQNSVSWNMDNTILFNINENDGRLTGTQPNRPREIKAKDLIVDSKHFFDLPFSNSLSVGIYYWYAWMQDFIATPHSFSQHTISLFAENEWEAFDGFKITLGMREDWNSRFGFHSSPKAYIVYEALPDYLILKGGVSMGYKAPFLNELIDGRFGADGPAEFFGNPDLKPESSLSSEISVISDNEYFELGATYFYSLFWDKIDFSLPVNNDVKRINVGRSYIQGVETYFGIKPFWGLNFDINYTFLDSMQLTGLMRGKPLNDTIHHRLNARLGYTFKDLNVYVRGELFGERFRGTSSLAERAALGEYYKPYFLLHLGATYRINSRFKLNFAVYNLLDVNFARYTQYGWESSAVGSSGSSSSGGSGGSSSSGGSGSSGGGLGGSSGGSGSAGSAGGSSGSAGANTRNYTGNALAGNAYPFIIEGRRYYASINMEF